VRGIGVVESFVEDHRSRAPSHHAWFRRRDLVAMINRLRRGVSVLYPFKVFASPVGQRRQRHSTAYVNERQRDVPKAICEERAAEPNQESLSNNPADRERNRAQKQEEDATPHAMPYKPPPTLGRINPSNCEHWPLHHQRKEM
jgi:hypothetical protein